MDRLWPMHVVSVVLRAFICGAPRGSVPRILPDVKSSFSTQISPTRLPSRLSAPRTHFTSWNSEEPDTTYLFKEYIVNGRQQKFYHTDYAAPTSGPGLARAIFILKSHHSRSFKIIKNTDRKVIIFLAKNHSAGRRLGKEKSFSFRSPPTACDPVPGSPFHSAA